MVFHAIAVWLLAASVPLWAYRWLVYAKLAPRERMAFKRLVTRRHESALGFGARVFGFLIALAAAVIFLVFGLRYLKHGTLEIGAFNEVIRNRLYSGLDPVDRALNAYHYEQPLPLAILTTCFMLAVGFTLVTSALRDISVISRLRRKLEGRRRAPS
ncbi:MAG: hypothetical protein Tsb0019_17890 [Roseibium sp.]